MDINLDLPLISGASTEAQVQQIKSYLFQMVQQLQWAFSQTESRETMERAVNKVTSAAKKEDNPVERFNSIKALIIKSADIVEAYYEKIDNLISTSGKYVAQSTFGTYTEDVAQQLSASADRIDQNIARLETITGAVDGIDNFQKVQQSYLHYGNVGTTLDDSGMASENAPGIEIGDYQVMDDGQAVTANRRFARFTAYGLELFGESKDAAPVAYIKQNRLFITNAEVTNSMKLGGFLIQKSNGLSFDWVGGN